MDGPHYAGLEGLEHASAPGKIIPSGRTKVRRHRRSGEQLV
jgi:hypothetical protein